MNKTIEALKLAEIEDLQDSVTKALKKAFQLGQTYWQQADSESFSQNKKADETQAKFYELEDETVAAIREALAEPEITTPDVCGEVCARAKLCYGCGKALDEANAKHEPLCEDEGCPHHGTPHICFSDPSVLDKPFACETGECPDKSLCAGACECLYKAEPVKQEPDYKALWEKMCVRCDELDAEIAKYTESEQEPVAWMVTTEGLDGTPKTYPLTGRYKDVRDMCDFGDPLPLYAAPVQQVELTVSDLDAIIEKHYDDEMDLKAMILDGIAAYKDKNK